jgi:hypothetical protein
VAGSAIVMPKVIPQLAVWCLLLAAFTSTWNGIRYLPIQIGDVLLALTCALIFGLVIFGNLRFSTPFWMWIAPIAVLLCLAIRQLKPIPWNEIVVRYTEPPYAPNNLPKAAFWLVALIFVPLAITGATAIDRRTPRFVMAAYTIGVCISAAVGLSDLLGLTKISYWIGVGNDVAARQSGLTNHSVTLGLTCVISVPFALYFIFRMRYKWIPAAGLLLLFGGVLASGSRGCQAAAILTCVVSLLVAPDKRDGSFKFAIVTLGVSGIVLLVFAELFVGDVLDQLFRFGDNTSNTGESDQSRTRLAQTAIQDFQQHPYAGLGLKWIVQAHSLPLQLLSAGGLILFFAVVTYWALILISAIRLFTRGHTIARYLFVAIFAWLALGFVENQLTDRYLYYTVGCVAALTSLYLSRGASADGDEQSELDDESTAAAPDAGRRELYESRR